MWGEDSDPALNRSWYQKIVASSTKYGVLVPQLGLPAPAAPLGTKRGRTITTLLALAS